MRYRRVLWCILMLALVTPSSVRASSLRGSHASQKKQNKEADREKLTRIETDAQLQKFKQAGLLVQLPQNEAVQIDDRLEQKWRWCRPWTAIFLRDLGKSYFAEFHESLQVNSAVRTIEYQQQLHKYNGNAAGTTGDRQSSHPTGATIDIAKKELNHEQLKWMRKRLLSFEKQNVIEATEEKKQSVFHIMVFNTYRNVKRPIHTPSR